MSRETRNFREDHLHELGLRIVLRALKKGYTETLMGGADHLEKAKERIREAFAQGRFKPTPVKTVGGEDLGFIGIAERPANWVLFQPDGEVWNIEDFKDGIVFVKLNASGPLGREISVTENGGDLSVIHSMAETEALIEEARRLAMGESSP